MGFLMLDQRVLAEWLEANCAAQGVPVHVTDPGVLARVGVLMGAAPGTDGRGSGRSTAAAS
ncbi:hypothetical protein AL755_18275 [Arthrobacter sp. ERGS1:01]|nr:hypothetical protein AL755_18275 [Arthrobacter sp. ERGS1:01]